MFRSIRSRITAGSTVIAALVLVALAVLLGEQVRHVAAAAVADLAKGDLQAYVADLTTHSGEAPDPPGSGVRILVLSPRGGRRAEHAPGGADGPGGACGGGGEQGRPSRDVLRGVRADGDELAGNLAALVPP